MYIFVRYERTGADYIEKLPKGKHSCKGIGMTHPDPQKSVLKDGVEIPVGNAVECKVKSSLLYNEYPLLTSLNLRSMIIITICSLFI